MDLLCNFGNAKSECSERHFWLSGFRFNETLCDYVCSLALIAGEFAEKWKLRWAKLKLQLFAESAAEWKFVRIGVRLGQRRRIVIGRSILNGLAFVSVQRFLPPAEIHFNIIRLSIRKHNAQQAAIQSRYNSLSPRHLSCFFLCNCHWIGSERVSN